MPLCARFCSCTNDILAGESNHITLLYAGKVEVKIAFIPLLPDRGNTVIEMTKKHLFTLSSTSSMSNGLDMVSSVVNTDYGAAVGN